MTDSNKSPRALPIMNQSPVSEAPPAHQGPPRPQTSDREAASRHPSDAPPLPDVRHVVGVSSGKGGVGKSTVSSNLAAAWAKTGARVGLLDADIYGPDIPTMFGVKEKPKIADQQVIPIEAHGVKLMSIGLLLDEDAPAIWRGPIVMGVIRQFLQQVAWGELDYLVVDLPPGTGDAQLSLCQLVRVDGAVMVTTPQDVSVGGVLRGIKMFEKLDVPVLGVVENMRGFSCPSCGDTHDIFGSGGGERLAASLEIPFLGAIPLGAAVREEGDRGVPTVIGRPDSPEGKALTAVSRAAIVELEAKLASSAPSSPSSASSPGGG
ncbi:MAG: Mrp/NBP35 family ATP-binding protein [Gemmatimonadota bacterium]